MAGDSDEMSTFALQSAINPMEMSLALQRFHLSVNQQLDEQRVALEAVVKEQSSQLSMQANKQHEQTLVVLNQIASGVSTTAHASPAPPTVSVPHIRSSSHGRSSVRASVSSEAALESLASKPEVETTLAELGIVAKRLEQSSSQGEELHEKLLAVLEGAAERLLTERLEVLYARHEARLESMLWNNEKAMEDYTQQLRVVSQKAGSRISVADPFEELNNVRPPEQQSSNRSMQKHMTDDVNFSKSRTSSSLIAQKAPFNSSFSSKRSRGCALDVAALSAVQGWRILQKPKKTRNSVQSRSLREFSEATLETASATLIFLNLIFLGIDAQVSLHSSKRDEPPPTWLWGISLLFLALLLLEIAVRVSLERWSYLLGPNWRWNLFDCLLATFQLLDSVLTLYSLNFLRTLRVLRALRTTRAVRTMKSVRELRIMIASVSNSVVSLMWAFLLLFVVLYAVSLVLVQSLVTHIQSAGADNVSPDLLLYYGSIYDAMVSLFQAVSGGKPWGLLLQPLQDVSRAYVPCYILFITFTVFGILNVLTAIFVESTSKMSAFDYELVIQEHLESKNSASTHLRKLLLEADADDSGTISKKEFEVKLSDPRFAAELSALELDIYEAHGLFNILQHDTSGVPIEEFIYGLMRMKGNAKGVDMVTMLSENRRILSKLLAFMEFMDDSFQDLKATLHIPGDTCLQDYLGQG